MSIPEDAEDLQDLNARTARGFQQAQIFSQGRAPDHFKDTERVSPGPLQELLTRTCTRSCKGFRKKNHFRISTRSSHKELYKIVAKGPAAAGAGLARS